MELSLQDWILVIGIVAVVAILGHGVWQTHRARRRRIGMKIEKNIPPVDVDELDLLRAELPNGGARVVPLEHEPEPPRAAPDSRGIDRAAAIDVLLADPPAPEPRPVAPERPPEPASGGGAARERGGSPRQARLDLDDHERVPVLLEPADGPEAAPGTDPDRGDGPMVAVDERGEAGRGRSRRSRRGKRAERAEAGGDGTRREGRGSASPADFEEVIVIRVVVRGGATVSGEALMDAIAPHNLMYGEFNIFHAQGPGGADDFGLANANEPGTFDLSTMDALQTSGVTMFLALPGPADPMAAYERLVGVAQALAGALDADLYDDRMSMMTAQTIEHYRQKVAEFVRRHRLNPRD